MQREIMGSLIGNKSKNAIQDDSYTAAQNEWCAIYLGLGSNFERAALEKRSE